jgi:hypothetical protein
MRLLAVITEPQSVARFRRQKNVRVLLAEVTGIDLRARRVHRRVRAALFKDNNYYHYDGTDGRRVFPLGPRHDDARTSPERSGPVPRETSPTGRRASES